ncbi:helix-turn-helix domain-containing protein [Nocardia sp. NPDC050412]|uniref:helix-turn-helix domain-containing protein n=1 Tax=Nocardia sp. NPDC050412 TaxID=3364320 RepID=UPI0037B45C12
MTGAALSQTCGAPVLWMRPGHVGYLGPEPGIRMHATTAHIRAEHAADAAGMSETHLLRTFTAHTGTTFRRYRQWARLRMVFASLAAGHDLARCAADAGFASPSHLSETFRRAFGASPTALLGSSVTFDIR